MPNTFPNLQALIDEAELSQVALAEAVPMRRATLNAWAQGGNARVDFDTLARLCKVLSKHLQRDITVDDLRKKPRK